MSGSMCRWRSRTAITDVKSSSNSAPATYVHAFKTVDLLLEFWFRVQIHYRWYCDFNLHWPTRPDFIYWVHAMRREGRCEFLGVLWDVFATLSSLTNSSVLRIYPFWLTNVFRRSGQNRGICHFATRCNSCKRRRITFYMRKYFPFGKHDHLYAVRLQCFIVVTFRTQPWNLPLCNTLQFL